MLTERKRCSHCSCNGHNSRKCGGAAGIRLFGVQIDVSAAGSGGESMRKTKSLGNLQSFNSTAATDASGYASDGIVHRSSSRKKGRPWTEEEHRSFLVGLEMLGKGDWKGIAANYVPSRNSAQVASHAQKYFIRLAASEKKRRRSSVFDIPLNDKQQQQQREWASAGFDGLDHVDSVTTYLSSSMKNSGQGSIAGSCERPPLSPMKRRAISNLQGIMHYPSRFKAVVMPSAVAWVPAGAGTSFVPQPSLEQLKKPRHCLESPPRPSLEHPRLRLKGSHPGPETPPTSNHVG